MTQTQLSFLSNRRFILSILFISLFGGMAVWTAQIANAAEVAACSIRISGQYQNVGTGEFTECANAIQENGDTLSGRYQVGRWGSYTVATDTDRNAWYRLNGRRQFSYYGTIPQTPVVQNPNDPDGDQIVGEADRCATEAETYNGVFDNDGCPDTIADLLTFAENDLNQWWDNQFEAAELTYYPPRRVVAYREPTNPRLNNNAFYTSAGHYIGYDLDLMESSLSRHGDFAPVAIMAHEWGHLVQANLGIRQEYTILQELQADCLAGAYGTYLEERGNLEEGDLEEGLRQMFAIGDSPNTPWFHPNAHGTGEQRYDAFLNGYENGVDSCLEDYSA
ncbi:MAG: neutral zinc metallopeptidase [Chloroflexota bacterium]